MLDFFVMNGRGLRDGRILCGLVALILCAAPRTGFSHPASGIVVDEKGQVYFSDADDGLWKIDAQGKVTRIHRTGGHWLVCDEKGKYSGEDLKKWFEQRITMNFGRISLPDSRGALLEVDGAPTVVDRDGNLCYGNLELSRLSPDGKVTLLTPTLKETADKLGGIKGLASGPDGCIYASCPSAILKIRPDGNVTTLIHPIVLKDVDVDTDLPRRTPENQQPYLRGLALDSQGAVYTAATGSRCVVKVTPDGKVEVVLKAEGPWSPTGVAVHGEDIYVLEYTSPNQDNHDKWLPRVRKLGRDGKVTTLATVSRKGEAPSK